MSASNVYNSFILNAVKLYAKYTFDSVGCAAQW